MPMGVDNDGYTYLPLWLKYWAGFSQTWPRGYKTFFMLNSAEHEILNAH